MSTYDIGDTVRLTASFRDEDGNLGNPTIVTCKVLAPDGTTTTVSTSTVSTGIYTATVAPDQQGTWRYRWAGTGAITTAEEGEFSVRRRRVT